MSEEKQRIPTVADLELFEYIPLEREAMKREALSKKIDELLVVFERDGAGVVDVREVATIVRAVGLNPSEAEVLEIIEEIEEASSVGYVKSGKLKHVVLQILMTSGYKGRVVVRDSEQKIQKAFETLDREGKGYIPSEYLKELLTSMGERFSGEEIVEMINAAADPETGNIYYEEFASILATE